MTHCKRLPRLAAFGLVAALAIGCTTGGSPCVDVDQAALACEALETEAQELTATATQQEAPVLDEAATVTLTDFEGQLGGFIEVGKSDPGGILLFLSADVTVALADEGGTRAPLTPLTPEDGEEVEACGQLPVVLRFEAEEESRRWIVVGPSPESSISVAALFADDFFYSSCD